MTDSLPDRIDRSNPDQLAALAHTLDATPQQIEEAIGAVGDKAADIEMHLKGTRSTSNAERTHEVVGDADGSSSQQGR